MNPSAGDQLDLLGRSEPEQERHARSSVLGLLLSQRAWLYFLTSEWLAPQENGQILLGVDCLAGQEVDPSEPSVAVWFDLAQLPKVTVRAFSDGKWESSELSALKGSHRAVAWNGPLPLFAVDHFGVATEDVRRHVLALTRSFRDIEPPKQPVVVEAQSELMSVGLTDHPALTGTMHPPANWNALRGAASMAAWAVPAIDPWLTLLCESLQDSEPNGAADVVHAKWWRTPLWTCHSNVVSDDPLWTAILNELGTVRGAKQLRARESLDSICLRATTLGADEERVSRLKNSTHQLLDDQTTIQKSGVIEDVLGLALQLLLLRPAPDRFIGWREDWPAMPPGSWWTGATLCGFLTGFRGLPVEFRGSADARRLLALRTWKLGCGGDTGLWDAVASEKLDWIRVGDSMLLRSNGVSWADHKISRRGRWYQLNFEDEAVQAGVQPFVREAQPQLMSSHLVLREGRVPFESRSGKGSLRVEQKNRAMVIKDEIEFELGAHAFIEKRFAVDRFKDWLATASIGEILPRPVFGAEQEVRTARVDPEAAPQLPELERVGAKSNAKLKPRTAPKSKPRTSKKVVATLTVAPSGLKLLTDFISADEERTLLATIDDQPWDEGMARKVQHYGWKYDYKARKVDPSSRIGPLPTWLQVLAARLHDGGIFQELPDQVIINNYVGAQAISKHVDCVPCFRGPVVTVSLNEAWEMLFAPKGAPEDAPRFGLVLPRRSAAVLDAEVRLAWTHEIPKRKYEGDLLRGRRVSVTFRKVDV